MKVFTQVILPTDHPFINNKYTIWYYGIINRATQRLTHTFEYGEIHHIIPDSLFKKRARKGSPGFVDGDSNNPSNLVKLTAREHIICHWLLIKMLDKPWAIKMEQALSRMAQQSVDRLYVIPSLLYARMKSAAAIYAKNTQWYTNGIKNTKSAVCPDGFKSGRSFSADKLKDLKENGAKGANLCTRGPWYTNGSTNIRSNNPPPDFYLGYTYSAEEMSKRRKGGFKAIETRKQNGTDKLSAESCAIIREGRKNQVWWTDGNINKLAKESPSPEFRRGFTRSQDYLNKKQAKKWWTNGLCNMLQEHCPDGYRAGRTPKIQKFWWTNGIENRFDSVCPLGFKSGRAVVGS